MNDLKVTLRTITLADWAQAAAIALPLLAMATHPSPVQAKQFINNYTTTDLAHRKFDLSLPEDPGFTGSVFTNTIEQHSLEQQSHTGSGPSPLNPSSAVRFYFHSDDSPSAIVQRSSSKSSRRSFKLSRVMEHINPFAAHKINSREEVSNSRPKTGPARSQPAAYRC
jgi:hypothetical protein